jgi:hypothetical protein
MQFKEWQPNSWCIYGNVKSIIIVIIIIMQKNIP